jgi:class 3 adenylate cyclase
MIYEQQRFTVRRLAAIVMADIAGFSRLMGADEAATAGERQWGLP